MSYRFALTALFALCVISSNVLSSAFLLSQDTPEPNEPTIAGASNEGEQSMGGYKVPEGVEGQLFAAEPMIANPVAFYVDDRGRVFVCETFRQSTGVVDNRSYGREWVDADLAAPVLDFVLSSVIGEVESAVEITSLMVRVFRSGEAGGDRI